MRAVILDADSLGPIDLDLGSLQALPLEWRIYPSTVPGERLERLQDTGVVLSNKVRLDADLLARLPALRLILVMATGTNNVDVEAARHRGIAVCNIRGYAARSVAQHTMMAILALARSLPAYMGQVAAGDWHRSPVFCLLNQPIRDLGSLRLGIVGYGAIGQEVARLAAAFGMPVALADLPGRNYPQQESPPRLPLPQLLRDSNVLSLHCPLTDQTRGLIDAGALALMPTGSLLVNTARGGIVDEVALLAALDSGHLGGAAVDTLEIEPPPAAQPLLEGQRRKLLVTPHNAWGTREARQRLLADMVDILSAFLAGRVLPNQLN